MDNIVDATVRDFNDFLSKGKLVVVHFSAKSCFPCTVVASSMEQLAPNLKSALFVKVDVDECKELASRFEVINVPTLIVFKEGKIAERVFGNVPKPYLEHLLRKHL